MSPAAPELLFSDRFLVVCDKPAGVSAEDGGMPELLQSACGGGRIFCVHRLDKAVSGVMVYAKDGRTAAALSAAVSGREVVKEYLAAVQGVPEAPEGVLRDLLFHDSGKNKTFVVQRPRRGVREAELSYRLVQTVSFHGAPLSLLRIRLGTGRTHQIRAQLAARRLPLAGDGRYGSTLRDGPIALRACRLAFSHPVTGAVMDFSVPLPQTWPWTAFSALA